MTERLPWIVILVCLLYAVQPIFAQQTTKTTIAVIDLASRGGLSQSEIGTLTDRLRSLLVQTQAFTVVDRGRMEEVLAEQGFQMSGCTSAECAVEAGQILGVEQMMTGSIGKIGRLYTIDIILIHVGTSQILKSLTRDYQGEVEGLVELMRSIANELGDVQKKPETVLQTVGGLDIESTPRNADVFIDNRPVGRTPLKLRDLQTGTVQLKIQTSGYAPHDDVVTIESGKTKPYVVKLKKMLRLSITSTPVAADIIINDKNIGQTPFSSNAMEGTRLDIQLKKENYKPWQTTLVLTRDVTLNQKLEMTEEYKKYLAAQGKKADKDQAAVKKSGSSKMWYWVGGGAVVVATAAYILVSGNGKEESKDFPAPPGRP